MIYLLRLAQSKNGWPPRKGGTHVEDSRVTHAQAREWQGWVTPWEEEPWCENSRMGDLLGGKKRVLV